MEGLLQLQPQGPAALLLRPPRLRRGRSHLRARASVRGGGVRPLTVNIDDLRLATSDHAVVNSRTTAAAVAPEGNKTAAEKLRLVADAAADRAEMHDIIGRQRDNWNHLLLHSTNSLTLAASAMAALAPTTATMPALKASAGILLATAAVTMAAVNKIQPSQLAEEQRNATRLWRQLERHQSSARRHGGGGRSMGMLFELCRNVSGFYRKVQEDIEACLEEVDVERRENGEVFEMKVALLLGRSSSELRQFKEMASPEVRDEDIKDFAGKLF
ncbi:hypothetical protein HU200_067161 [Digitaria exilis]|uniref:F-box protein n=1 Tax=Digitaria exilis TaxID=1010633 RepID=A0A834ZWJ7_9POAL|nr:hypothetical protein HU200_067161 [Digitaria exilis]